MAQLVRSIGILLVALGGLLLAGPALAETANGAASAIDGDSLNVGGREVRLFGIDAPEYKQTCRKDGADWACGEAARDALEALLKGGWVTCQGFGVDIYKRLLAVCAAGGIELNRTLVERGWAIALRYETDAYNAPEARAKSARLGIWASIFISPAEFRGVPLPTEPVLQVGTRYPASVPVQQHDEAVGCMIKGNRSLRGEWIYYLPGMPYYNETNAEEIFCSEAAARAAGYRRARVPRSK